MKVHPLKINYNSQQQYFNENWPSIPKSILADIPTYKQKTNYTEINAHYMLQDTNLITWTFRRKLLEIDEKEFHEKNKKIIANIEKIFKQHTQDIAKAIEEICISIFENNKDVNEIDITIRLINDYIVIMLTDDGYLYNPINNEKLIKSDSLKKLSSLHYELDYDEILGFNKTYLKIKN